VVLFQLNFCTSLFEVLLEILCLCLAETFFEDAGSTVNHFFGFLQTQTGKLFNELNYLQFSCTCALKNYVKRGLLLSGGSTGSRTGSNCYGSSSGFDTILVLEDLSEFVYFFYGQVNQLLCKSF